MEAGWKVLSPQYNIVCTWKYIHTTVCTVCTEYLDSPNILPVWFNSRIAARGDAVCSHGSLDVMSDRQRQLLCLVILLNANRLFPDLDKAYGVRNVKTAMYCRYMLCTIYTLTTPYNVHCPPSQECIIPHPPPELRNTGRYCPLVRGSKEDSRGTGCFKCLHWDHPAFYLTSGKRGAEAGGHHIGICSAP